MEELGMRLVRLKQHVKKNKRKLRLRRMNFYSKQKLKKLKMLKK